MLTHNLNTGKRHIEYRGIKYNLPYLYPASAEYAYALDDDELIWLINKPSDDEPIRALRLTLRASKNWHKLMLSAQYSNNPQAVLQFIKAWLG